MRFMIIVKNVARPDSGPAPGQLADGVRGFQNELAQAGVLLDASAHSVAGYAVIQVRSRAEADQWSRRVPEYAEVGTPLEVEVVKLAEAGDW